MYKQVHTSIYEEHGCTMILLLCVTPFISLGWRNTTPEQIKQKAFQFTKYFKYKNFNYVSTTQPLNISPKTPFDTK